MKRWFLILFAAFSVWTTSAHAETTKVVVRSFSGPGAAGVRRAVVKQLKTMKGVKVVDEAAAERVAKKNHVSLAGNNGKREVAGVLQISAWVEGTIKKRGGKFAASIEVTDAASGQEAGAWSFAAKKPKLLEATVKRNFKKKLRDAFSDVHPPEASGATEEPEEEASTPDEPEESEEPYPATDEEPVQAEPVAEVAEPLPEPVAQAEDEEKPSRSFSGDDAQRIDGDEAEEDPREHSALAAYAGLAILNRSLEYNQAFTQNIGNYSLPAAPIADFGLRVYPGAFLTDGWGAHIGLDLHGQLAFGLNSETSDGTRYPTSYLEYDGSLIGRLPIGRHELHLAVGYKAQSFSMEDRGTEAPVADVDYKAARAGLGGRFELVEGYGLGFDVAYLYLFGLGELESEAWFPNATGAGIEGQVFVDARLYKAFGARLFASYQRQFFDFNSQLNDTRVAGGAVDAYISGGLALALNY